MILDCASRSLDLSQPQIMGILNVTPDSFADGGRHQGSAEAIAHGLRMEDDGAAIIDVGGESTRPGSQPVSVAQELDRVIPVVERLSERCAIPISVDTSKPEIMQAAVAAGAGLINDVWALRRPGALAAAAAARVPVCIMHMQGEPGSMQTAPRYHDVVAEVAAFLRQRVDDCVAAGIPASSILVDPGFGFGKTLEHNLALLRELPQLAELGAGLLVGMSRKSMLGALTGRAVGERQVASAAAALLAAERGARVLRVHDVGATRDALLVLAALRP
jgi:dihydropteroate synthase